MVKKVKIASLSALFILFPVFFLPITQEFFLINKFMLVFVIASIIGLTSLIEFIIKRKLDLNYSNVDASILFILFAISASILVSSPNKITALFTVPFGLFPVLSLVSIYCFIKNTPKSDWTVFKPGELLGIGANAAGIFAIIFYLNPLKSVTVPASMAFLKTPLFNTIGSILDLLLFFGFFVAMAIANLVSKKKRNAPILVAGAIATVVALLHLFQVFSSDQLRLPPVSHSWLAAIETLKRAQTAIFGVGIDNFAGQFTIVKNTAYNMSSLWNVNFALSRSAVLHIWTEAGLLGLTGALLLIAMVVKTILKLHESKDSHANAFIITGLYLLFTFVCFPPSFPQFFLLSAYLGTLVARSPHRTFTIDFSKMLLPYLVIIFAAAIVFPTSAYAVLRMYSSEMHFKKSLNALTTGAVAPIYGNLQRAIIINPYETRYRLAFSQLNLLIANNIAISKSQNITEQDRQNITLAIQDAIREAKAAVALNPDSASTWENLAIIYQNLLNVAQGADAWAISAYQKAILLDPVNPQLRLALGGVYFSLKQFPNATTFFSQAVNLKPDWPNARYNLAWALFQNKDFDQAILVMKNVMTLLENGSGDYAKAQSDLKVFEETKANSGKAETAPVISTPTTSDLSTTQAKQSSDEANLELPAKPEAVVSPKITLPTETPPAN